MEQVDADYNTVRCAWQRALEMKSFLFILICLYLSIKQIETHLHSITSRVLNIDCLIFNDISTCFISYFTLGGKIIESMLWKQI